MLLVTLFDDKVETPFKSNHNCKVRRKDIPTAHSGTDIRHHNDELHPGCNSAAFCIFLQLRLSPWEKLLERFDEPEF